MPAERKASLRAVQPGESAHKQSVDVAAASGNHLSLLIAMRDRIAMTVADPDCPPRDLAALTRRLQEIAKEIEGIKQKQKDEAREDGASSGEEKWDAEAI